jgi:hypothetical protein
MRTEEIRADRTQTPVVVDARDAKHQRPPGRPKKEVSEETVDNINGSNRPVGTTQAQALRRLRTQRPEIRSQLQQIALGVQLRLIHHLMMINLK